MKSIRKVKLTLKSKPVMEGAGVRLKRAFGYVDSSLDPFLLLDNFHSDKPNDYNAGFPFHPHRGFETITYMLHGKIEHRDNLGNGGVIESGGVQWMTAGSGIIHQEMPLSEDNDSLLWGLQLWSNLPASHKMMKPRYRNIEKEEIPTIELNEGVKVKIVSGEVNGTKGPVQNIITEPEFLDVSIPSNSEFRHQIAKGNNVFAYLLEGRAYFDDESENLIGSENLVIYKDGDEVLIKTKAESVRFILVSAKPIKEPVAWRGSIVMNTDEEIRIAFQELQNDTFIKHK